MADYKASNVSRPTAEVETCFNLSPPQMRALNHELNSVIIDATVDLNISTFCAEDVRQWYPEFFKDRPVQYVPNDVKQKASAMQNLLSLGKYLRANAKYIGIEPTIRRQNRQMYCLSGNEVVRGCMYDE